MGKARRVYLAGQGIAVLAWWVVLWLAPSTRELFEVAAAPDVLLGAFLPGDLIFLVGGSLWSARQWTTGPPPPVVWVVSGALWILTVYTWSLMLMGALGWFGPALMGAASVGMVWVLRAD